MKNDQLHLKVHYHVYDHDDEGVVSYQTVKVNEELITDGVSKITKTPVAVKFQNFDWASICKLIEQLTGKLTTFEKVKYNNK